MRSRDEPSGAAELVDRTGTRYPLDVPRWRGDDGGPLMVTPTAAMTPDEVDAGSRSHWRYRAALPAGIGREVSLGEGHTPLVEARVGGVGLKAKLEWFNPTASFKDRGVSVMMSMLAGQGVDAVLEDSSGNGGASVAAYAAACGVRATILAPGSTSQNKTLQSRMHGAAVELVPGSREQTAREALRRSAGIFYASHNWHPMFLQGVKLLAYEIWEDLGFRAPANVVVPAGAGSLVLGCGIGFGELLRAGQIARMPRLLVAQPENCAPIAAAFRAGAADVVACDEWTPTIAEGTSITAPVRGPEVLAAIRDSRGEVQTVTEEQIRSATHHLAGLGLYVEPTSAVAAAAVGRFVARGLLDPDEETVLVLTGSGLKAADALRRLV
ncbi:threonine synthase [Pseudonocardia acaciae]|uniref:threonine synthase n=1 Tax=Pseudonocardia acaciae TaxID=551276 RepID=UPI0005684A33|nr:pyridoxal-phosphate dependent enzyme [Pseudonocardia acaciae]